MIKKTFILLVLIITSSCSGNINYDDGLFYFDNKDYFRASREFIAALRKEPFNLEIHHNLAKAYLRSNRTQEAIFQYQTIYSINNKDKKAIEELRKIIDGLFIKAQNQLLSKKYVNAFEIFKKVLEIDIENKKAQQAIENMLSLFIEQGNKLYSKGTIKDQLKAVKYYKNALEIDPSLLSHNQSIKKKLTYIRDIYQSKAEKIRNVDAYAAIDAFEQAKIADPFNGELYFKIGQIYSFFSEFKQDAILSFIKAIEIDPYTSKYHAHLGELYYLKPNYSRAKKEYSFSFMLIEKEISINKYKKKPYKYFFDSIKSYNSAIKEFDLKKGIFLRLGKKDKVKINLKNENLLAYKKALDIYKLFPKLYQLVKESKLIEAEKADISKNIQLILNLISKNEEDINKEKEVYTSLKSQFLNIGDKADKKIIKFGELIGIF